MEKFDFIIDEKVTVWKRSMIVVEAESYEEALKRCKQAGSDAADQYIDTEYLNDTEEYLDTKDSLEVMSMSYTPLYYR